MKKYFLTCVKAPESEQVIFELIKAMKKAEMPDDSDSNTDSQNENTFQLENPILIHCFNGYERSGLALALFLAIDNIDRFCYVSYPYFNT